MRNEQHTPRIALLGWCERASQVAGLHPAMPQINIQGLSQGRFSHFFPVSVQGLSFVVGIYNPTEGESFTVEFRHSDGTKAFDFVLNLNEIQTYDPAISQYRPLHDGEAKNKGWTFQIVHAAGDSLVIRPDTFRAMFKDGSTEHYLGSFAIGHVSVAPYSPDQIAALRTDPLARRVVRIGYGCKQCGAKFQTYAALERDAKQEQEGWKWSGELDGEYQCSCGGMKFSLEYLRTGLHGMLSRNLAPSDQLAGAFVRLYEVTKLEDDSRTFKSLIDAETAEQQLQDFLEAHPFFFSRFSANRLIPKPQIQKYFADFAILNQRKELLLVEIEKPQLRLLTKERRITADLQHAITQVRDWIQEVNDHRAAVLSMHKIELREVAVVKGVVVAGRSPTEHEDARALRRAFSDIEFFTYDDLLRDVTEIIRRVANA